MKVQENVKLHYVLWHIYRVKLLYEEDIVWGKMEKHGLYDDL